MVINIDPAYDSLGGIFAEAIRQACDGKGRERHAADGEPFEGQIICEVSRRVGIGYPLGQAAKKIYESRRLGGERGVAELLGAMNYIAAACLVLREQDQRSRAQQEVQQPVRQPAREPMPARKPEAPHEGGQQ